MTVCVLCILDQSDSPSSSVAVRLPYAGPKLPADTEADTHTKGNDDQAYQHLDQYPVALAQFGEALARVLVDFCGLGLLLPVCLSRPHLTICAALEVAVAHALHTAGIITTSQGPTRDHGLQVGVKGVQVIVGSSRRRNSGWVAEAKNGAGRRYCQGVGGGSC